MQFESDYRFEMEDGFALSGHGMMPTSSAERFSSVSSTSTAYDPFTPTSRHSTPHGLNLDFVGTCQPFSSHHGELTPPPASMPKYFHNTLVADSPKYFINPLRDASPKYFINPFKQGQDRSLSFSEGTLTSTPLKKMNEMVPGYDHMLDIGVASQQPMGSLTPSNSFSLYTHSQPDALHPSPFLMTPTRNLSSSDLAESTSSSWSCANDSPVFFSQKGQSPHDAESLDLDRYDQSPAGSYYLQGTATSPLRLKSQRKMMVNGIQQKTADLQNAQIRASSLSMMPERHDSVDVVRKAMCKCDYPGCHKAFRRNEHLKRHKQTFHGEGPNKFMCEFCGKDQFNRQDNLNNHRKLHARPNSRNRGVEFIPGAVAVIEQEERSRKRRAPPKSKTLAALHAKHEDDDYE